MPKFFDELEDGFRQKAFTLVQDCIAAGKPMRPFYALRDVYVQARLWRQSRSTVEIETGVSWIRQAGGLWIAEVIERVGPQFGRWATNAAPGNSWHQWGAAIDCYALVDGAVSWDTIPGKMGGPGDEYYRFYAKRAVSLGLTPLGPSIGDWVHVQAYAESAPSRTFSWGRIDSEMRKRFGS